MSVKPVRLYLICYLMWRRGERLIVDSCPHSYIFIHIFYVYSSFQIWSLFKYIHTHTHTQREREQTAICSHQSQFLGTFYSLEHYHWLTCLCLTLSLRHPPCPEDQTDTAVVQCQWLWPHYPVQKNCPKISLMCFSSKFLTLLTVKPNVSNTESLGSLD